MICHFAMTMRYLQSVCIVCVCHLFGSCKTKLDLLHNLKVQFIHSEHNRLCIFAWCKQRLLCVGLISALAQSWGMDLCYPNPLPFGSELQKEVAEIYPYETYKTIRTWYAVSCLTWLIIQVFWAGMQYWNTPNYRIVMHKSGYRCNVNAD